MSNTTSKPAKGISQISLFLPLEEQKYHIYIGKEILLNIQSVFDFEKYTKIIVITDKIVGRYHLPKLLKGLPRRIHTITVDPGEKEKNIATVQSIWVELLRVGADRNSCVINLGGGVVCDMGGFAASTYMRGIDFIQIPTTLLAQVDASVGGKVAIDFANVKNLIGSFCQPQAVIIDPDTLQTLSRREYLSGFAEIIKHGLIRDKKYFELVTKKAPSELTEDDLKEIIEKSCRIKADIVKSDEKEGGLRKVLNFGHTVGHAIESLSQSTEQPLLHGEAISIGMTAEAKISQEMGLLTSDEFDLIETSLVKAGLPTRTINFDYNSIISLIEADKKNSGGKILWTLLDEIGVALFNQEVPPSTAKKGIEYVSSIPTP